MSLILDALRKSEHQRQRHTGPGFAAVPEAAQRQRPATWMIVLGGLLALNVLVLAALLFSDRQDAPTAATPSAGGTARAAATSPSPTTVPLPARPRRDDVRPLTTEAAPAAPPRAAQDPPANAADAVSPMVAATAAATPSGESTATADARLPRFADLVVRGELAVPNMHLDIHVYSSNAAERFVFINMRKYVEGQATQEGPRVQRITGEGVIMDHQGTRFLLARD
jgi:general secretion pathway protein B